MKAATRSNPNLHCQREVRSDKVVATTNTSCSCSSKPSPPRVDNVDGVDQRIYVSFKVEGYCTGSYPLSEDDMQSIPVQLFNNGVTEEQWIDHVQRLCKVNKMRYGYCSLYCPGIVVAFTLPFCLPLFCRRDAQFIKAWDDALRKWQDDFNYECLIPLGMFCKTQSNSWSSYGGNNEESRHFDRWIAFALTPENVVKLKMETHLRGSIDDCYSRYCGAYPESKCCIHPRN